MAAERVRAGRLGGRLYLGAGLLTLVTAPVPGDLPGHRVTLAAAGLVAVALGLLALRLPWDRWPGWVPLVTIVPAGLALVSGADATGGISPYSYGVYYVVLFVWAGLTQSRRTIYLLAVPATAAYLAPTLLGARHWPNALTSTDTVIPVCLLVGQTLAGTMRQARLAQRQAERLALRDPLTGLHNRRGLAMLADQRLEPQPPGPSSVSVLVIDVDGLKEVNDQLGHASGDELLQAAAELLTETFRAGDVVARLGGDEFCVLLDPASQPPAAARRLASALAGANARRSAQGLPPLAFSVGCATAPVATRADWDRLLAAADAKMYADKRGRAEAGEPPGEPTTTLFCGPAAGPAAGPGAAAR